MRAHFIGIAGIGMSATAKLLKDEGWAVGGSDDGCYPPASDYLTTHGIPFVNGYRAENIPTNADVIVIGRNAKLSPEENEEVRVALQSGKRIASFPEILGELAKETENIVVAGSYGKSTCAALLAHCLLSVKKDPSFFIGAIPLGTGESARIGHGNLFVLEGDEYPTSHSDPRPKFAHYNPHDVLFTSGEHDHFNVYPTLESYLKPFQDLLASVPKDGFMVAAIAHPHVVELTVPYNSRVITYGFSESTLWSAKDIRFSEHTSFALTRGGEKITTLTTSLLGKHNVENIVGISALLLEKRLLTPEELAKGIATFKGIARRLDRKTEKSSVLIYEGFGSSYEKARAAIEAMKLHFPERRLVIVFEPHTFSWRNRASTAWYDDVFKGAEKVFIFHPATQGAETHDQLTQEEIVARVRGAGFDITPITNAKDGLEQIRGTLKSTDVLLLLTSGNLEGLVEQIPTMAEREFPA